MMRGKIRGNQRVEAVENPETDSGRMKNDRRFVQLG